MSDHPFRVMKARINSPCSHCGNWIYKGMKISLVKSTGNWVHMTPCAVDIVKGTEENRA